MDEDNQPINPAAPEAPTEAPDRMAQEARVRLALQRKFSNSDEAQILSATTSSHRHGHRFRKTLITCLLLLTICALSGLALNMFFIPKLMLGLPGLLRSPYAGLSSYKRTVKGFIDYYPPVTVTAKKAGISEFDHGASFSLLSSADIIPHKGLEGVLRLDLEKTQSAFDTSDIDLGYKVLFPESGDGVGVYFFFNQWPPFLQELGITGDSRGVWFGYDSESKEVSQEGVNELVSIFNPESHRAETQQFIATLWRYAAERGAIQWRIEKIIRKDSSGTRVTDISISLDPEKFSSALASFVKDPSYTPEIRALGQTPIGGTTIMGLLQSIRSLSGLITIGINDRFIHEAAWNFDINDRSAGTYRGSITTTLNTMATKKEIVTPEKGQSAVDILSLFVTEDPLAGSAAIATTTDSDSDGLEDTAEAGYKSDPLVTDTDKDGFSDGDEVSRGYDPAGPGKLKQ